MSTPVTQTEQSSRCGLINAVAPLVGDIRPCCSVAIVVPCFNEHAALAQLVQRLERVEQAFPDNYEVQWCFVDDGSDDGTWQALEELRLQKRNLCLARHTVNRGLAAAILTGVAHTSAQVVCSIDADCTYDPEELPAMLEHLTDDVAVVTASPYHPSGRVDGVSAWRLLCSRIASRCYRGLSRNKLYTYTSCFRVYRRAALEGLELRHRRFAGVAELLWRVDQRGGKVVEYPTVLRQREFGRSKLRLVPVVFEHARLLLRCAWQRVVRSPVVSHVSDSGLEGNIH